MTLIAAYRPFGVTILIGDFLITGGRLKASRKKIYKISPNFVIGWTGNVIDARPLMKLIFEKFENKRITFREIEEYLTARPADKHGTESLHLIGWVIDGDNPQCFLWNIAYPTELYVEPFHTDGTGGGKFRELVTRENLGGPLSIGSRTHVDQAIHSVLAKTAELYGDENLEKLNQNLGFGHGYELLFFDGNEFRYLENIAFSGMDILMSTDGTVKNLRFYDFWYRYHSLGDASFLQVVNTTNGDLFLETIEPVFRKKLADASFEFVAGSFRAAYYCFYFRLQEEGGGVHGFDYSS